MLLAFQLLPCEKLGFSQDRLDCVVEEICSPGDRGQCSPAAGASHDPEQDEVSTQASLIVSAGAQVLARCELMLKRLWRGAPTSRKDGYSLWWATIMKQVEPESQFSDRTEENRTLEQLVAQHVFKRHWLIGQQAHDLCSRVELATLEHVCRPAKLAATKVAALVRPAAVDKYAKDNERSRSRALVAASQEHASHCCFSGASSGGLRGSSGCFTKCSMPML